MMNRKAIRWVLAVGLAALAMAASVSAAGAFSLRSPQVVFLNGPLQGFLNGNDGGINTLTDQLDAQVWASSVSGNATFTLMIEMSANAPLNALGVYNSGAPAPLFQVFPGAASAGWFATCHFGPGGALAVLLYDQNAVFQGQTNYVGVNRASFGFYIQGPTGLFFSQDALNGGKPQVLTYAGTGINFGDWWECFDDSPYSPVSSNFDDAVLLLQSVAPTPNHGTTWGNLKKLYR